MVYRGGPDPPNPGPPRFPTFPRFSHFLPIFGKIGDFGSFPDFEPKTAQICAPCAPKIIFQKIPILKRFSVILVNCTGRSMLCVLYDQIWPYTAKRRPKGSLLHKSYHPEIQSLHLLLPAALAHYQSIALIVWWHTSMSVHTANVLFANRVASFTCSEWNHPDLRLCIYR